MTEHVKSYYAASANPHAPYPTLTEQLECDVCVIGAGYTGLSSALHLVEKGYKVVLLDRARHPRFHIGESLLPANLPLFERLGVAVPSNPWTGKGAAPPSLADACESAIQGEIENVALYDRLIPMIEDPAARQVMENLQAASRERHLPAFRRCLERERGRGS